MPTRSEKLDETSLPKIVVVEIELIQIPHTTADLLTHENNNLEAT